MFFSFLFVFIGSKRYKEHDEIPVYGTKVSPYTNPFESYDYFSLPFCPYSGSDLDPPKRMFDAFLGNNLQRTGLTLKFAENKTDSNICTIHLNEQTAKKFSQAVEKKFYYQLYIDKLPVWAMVGAKGLRNKTQHFVFSLQHFVIYYNQNRIISVSLNPEMPVPLEMGNIDFSYTVEWLETNQTKSQRIQNYNNNKFFNNARTLSNVFYMIGLVGVCILIAIIALLRSIGNDFSRFQRESEYNDFEIDFHAEKGWKMIHADVFRPPRNYTLLSILFGNGAQIFTALLIYFIFNVLFGQHFNRDTYIYIMILSYSIAGFVGGYFSAGLYKRWGGTKWIPQLLATTYLVPSLFFSSEFILDTFSLFSKVTKLSKIKPYIFLFFVLCFIITPLTIFGGIIGRHWFIIGPNPTRVSMIRRTIPPQPLYLKNYILCLIIGFISFGSVYMEIHTLLNAIIQYQVNTIWALSLIILILLACVVSCLTVLAVYRKLSSEDYEWQWISFMGPFSISLFIFIYSIVYFDTHTSITGILQTLYFFSYTGVLSLTGGIVCGFIGFSVSAIFVRKIYTNIKAE